MDGMYCKVMVQIDAPFPMNFFKVFYISFAIEMGTSVSKSSLLYLCGWLNSSLI